MTKLRAKRGGEIGKNGEYYKGGSFLPGTSLPKRGRARTASGPKRWLVGPGHTAAIPEGRFAIFETVRHYVIVTDAGIARKFTDDHPASAYMGPEWLAWLDEMIAEYNSGTLHLPVDRNGDAFGPRQCE